MLLLAVVVLCGREDLCSGGLFVGRAWAGGARTGCGVVFLLQLGDLVFESADVFLQLADLLAVCLEQEFGAAVGIGRLGLGAGGQQQ